MRNFFYLFCLFCTVQQGFAQLKVVQFEQLESLQKVEKRNVIIFIHADWCKYCQVMKAKTFKNQEVINRINKQFYFIDLNAEEKRKIKFNNANFAFKPNGISSGIHELATELGTIDGQVSYPTICVLNDKNEIVFQHNSFLNANELLAIFEKI